MIKYINMKEMRNNITSIFGALILGLSMEVKAAEYWIDIVTQSEECVRTERTDFKIFRTKPLKIKSVEDDGSINKYFNKSEYLRMWFIDEYENYNENNEVKKNPSMIFLLMT